MKIISYILATTWLMFEILKMYFYSYISEKQEGGFINVTVHHIGCY